MWPDEAPPLPEENQKISKIPSFPWNCKFSAVLSSCGEQSASLTGSISSSPQPLFQLSWLSTATAISLWCLFPSHSWAVPTFTNNIPAKLCCLGVSGQSHSSASKAASHPGILSGMTPEHDETSDANIIVPWYPTLSASLVQGTQSQIPNQQSRSLSLPYQKGSQVHYYNPGTLGPQVSGELGSLAAILSVSYIENRASAHQSETVMVSKEAHPTSVLPTVSTSEMYYSVSAQSITENQFSRCLPVAKENQNPSTASFRNPYIQQLLSCIDPLGRKKSSLSLQKESQRSQSHQGKSGTEKVSLIKGHSIKAGRSVKLPRPIQGAPKDKNPAKEPREPIRRRSDCYGATTSDSASVNKGKHSSNNLTKAASSRSNTTKRHGQEKTKRSRENSSKNLKESGTKVKAEEKQTITTRRKKNQRVSLAKRPSKSHELPRRCTRPTRKLGFSASQTLGSSGNTENPQAFSAVKLRLDIQREGKGPEKTQLKAQKMEDSAEKECPSPSQYELPPPGKVNLIPRPFLTLDKPQARPVSRRPHPPASRGLLWLALLDLVLLTQLSRLQSIRPKPAPTHTSPDSSANFNLGNTKLVQPTITSLLLSLSLLLLGQHLQNIILLFSLSGSLFPLLQQSSVTAQASKSIYNPRASPWQPRSWRIPDISGPNKEKSQDITDIAPFNYSGWRRGSKPQSKRRTSQACDSKSETQGPQKVKPTPRSHELERPCQGTRHITFRGCGFRSSSWPRSVQESRVPGPSHCGDGAIGSCESREATHPMPSRPRAPVRRSQCQDKTLNRETRKSPTQSSRFSLLGKPVVMA
ncbi:LOW QUALITY PROTEIN: hypothetical protein AAY473_040469 [Plecturocebus cupreus]